MENDVSSSELIKFSPPPSVGANGRDFSKVTLACKDSLPNCVHTVMFTIDNSFFQIIELNAKIVISLSSYYDVYKKL
jgi:hypothetical protein